MDNGDVLSINSKGAKKEGNVPAGDVYVDGNRIGDVGGIVIRDRILMANDGIIVLIANINQNKELVGNTIITIPKIDEQQVLGQYLENIDNLITLHQRKP